MNTKQENKNLNLSFENTEVAFKSMSDRELKRAYWLFKMVSKPWMVNVGKKLSQVALGLNIPFTKTIIKNTIYKQFVGGESLSKVSDTVDRIKKDNIGSILDYSVEGVNDDNAYERIMLELMETVKISSRFDSVPFCVFKMSALVANDVLEKANNDELTEKADIEAYRKFKVRLERLFKLAFQMNTPILVDAEESWIQNAIDGLVEEMMLKYNKENAIVYNTIQMYRWDRLDYLKKCHQHAKENEYTFAIKLVRGAYMEKERERAQEMGYKDPIQPNKEATDKDYNEALRYAIENREEMALMAGTHNEGSSMLLAQLLAEHDIDHNDPRFYFAQLLGMSDNISYNLSSQQYNVAKYVPYGPIRELMPYLIRRAQENTSAAEQTGRELGLIIKEMKRRKKSKQNKNA